ncbi:hybrid sensor histidine kinase/response regulator [Sphingobium nicotianae]|uniref:histidine kinase n=1 Tax=Sphingobium nicotianae TaxID=2782607 RepID=A0A9X1ISS1_9SPHN|nr:PAS domain-containing sensor histidine kinase [Sphingobium nicotianae]MBT2188881.1 PAS domain S-box protein [Sphingobium nicotianae]
MSSDQGFADSTSSEGRYRLLVDAITDYAIYMLDPTGIISNWNSGAQRLKGYRADEIVGQHFSRFYTPEDRDAGVPEEALRTARTQGKFEWEGWQLRKNGERFWAHVVIDPIWAASGELLGFAKITRDLTERQIAAKELRQSEEQFRLLVQSVTDYAIYRLDETGHVVSWNAGAERIKGYAPEEIIGQHFSRFYTQEDRAAGGPERALAIAREEGRFAAEGWRQRKDGTRFRASVVIDPIRDESGAIVGFAKITRDVTEREEVQRKLDEAREALFQSQKMEAIGQLTGGVAHDFNNLLMAIQSSLALLEKRVPSDPQLHRLIDNAMQGTLRGAALTQRMLAFARRQDLTFEAIDIPALVRNMSDLLERTLGPSYSISLQFPLSLPQVLADANQLEMALLNLAVNARDAMPDGGTIAITARQERVKPGVIDKLEPGSYVTLAVIDTGTGMDARTLAHATEPFFTTKGVGKGTGLGLSMIHGLAEQMGGRLVLQSAPGEGTTAELWLPAVPTAVAPSETAPVAAAPAPSPTAAMKILVVDDDGLVLMNTVALLEDLGHGVIEAGNGRDALALLQSCGDLDLIITDQAMPHMTGVQFAEQALALRPGIPIILATGYGELPADAPASLRKLGKPFSQRDLADALAQAVNALV